MLEDIDEEFEVFNKRLLDIKKYINLLEIEKNILQDTEQLKEIENIGCLIESIAENKNSQVTYNAIIISIYGCFENYIDNILKKYLEKISSIGISYNELPNKIKITQTNQIGNFLANSNRYKNYNMNINTVISDYNGCLTDIDKYVLNSKLILNHSGNLGCEALMQLFSQIGIENVFSKIKQNNKFVEYYAQKNEIEISDTKAILSSKDNQMIFNILEDLKDRRNEIAHSWNEDNRLSFTTINEEYIEFFKIFGNTIKEIIINEIYNILDSKKKLIKFEKIYGVIRNKIVCLNNMNLKLKKDSYIFIKKKNGENETIKIVNIQINNSNVEEVTTENTDVGLELDGIIKKSFEFYYYDSDI